MVSVSRLYEQYNLQLQVQFSSPLFVFNGLPYLVHDSHLNVLALCWHLTQSLFQTWIKFTYV